MLRPATRVDVRQVMEQERAEFVRLLRSLSEEDWNKSTVCDGWTVGDLAVHLLGDDLSFLSRNRDAQRNESRGVGSAGPQNQNDAAQDWDHFVDQLDVHNDRWVQAGGFLSTRLVAELLEFSGRAVAEFLEAADPSAPGEVVSWAGSDPAPWWLVGAREFTERWVHHQQIRDAIDKPGLNGPSFVAPILGTAMHGVPRAYEGLEAPEGTTVAIDVTGRAGFSWAVRRDSDGWKLYEGLTREATARLSVDQATAWRFLMGMMGAAESKRKVTVEGNESLTEPFFGAVSAIVRRT
ncbi:MAG: maleylpyruvate isomerase N-terminal domain-containing protein [Actinomycetota bacterium]